MYFCAPEKKVRRIQHEFLVFISSARYQECLLTDDSLKMSIIHDSIEHSKHLLVQSQVTLIVRYLVPDTV